MRYYLNWSHGLSHCDDPQSFNISFQFESCVHTYRASARTYEQAEKQMLRAYSNLTMPMVMLKPLYRRDQLFTLFAMKLHREYKNKLTITPLENSLFMENCDVMHHHMFSLHVRRSHNSSLIHKAQSQRNPFRILHSIYIDTLVCNNR